MKLKVISQFRDKHTNEHYSVGQIITVTEKRGKEILSSEYNVAELIKEEPKVEEANLEEDVKAEAPDEPKAKPTSKAKKKSDE